MLIKFFIIMGLPSIIRCLGESEINHTIVYANECSNSFGISDLSRTLVIPSNFTRHGNQKDQIIILRLTKGSLNCKDTQMMKFSIFWKDGKMQSPQNVTKHQWTRDFGQGDGPSKFIPIHFLESGEFFDGKFYFSPNGDYCINSFNEHSTTLHLCRPDPQKDIYLPKCCAFNEVIHRYSTCRKLSNEQPKWTPELNFFDSRGGIWPMNTKGHLKSYIPNLSSKCDTTETGLEWWSPTGRGSDVKHITRLVVTPANPTKIVPYLFDNSTRKWQLKESLDFCVDGTYLGKGPPENYSVFYLGNPEDFVIFFCSTEEDDYDVHAGKAWVYAITTLISSLCLLATVIVYLVLYRQHNLHGLTVLMYSMSMLGRYVCACIAFFIWIYPNYELTGVDTFGWPCVGVGILGHYFYLASYMWLTVMNYDVFCAVCKIKLVQSRDRQPMVFLSHCLLAWGIPVILVVSFIIIDIIYADPLTEVPVPAYGDLVCFVARPFRGIYVYTPMGVMMGLNTILVSLTFGAFCKARIRRTMLNSEKVAKSSTFSVMFFLRLFVVMGGSDIVSYLTWFYHDPSKRNDDKPWWVVGLEGGNFLTPVIYFALFCFNPHTGTQLKDWFRVRGFKCCLHDDGGANISTTVSSR